MTKVELETQIETYINNRIYDRKEKNLLKKLLIERDNSFISYWVEESGDIGTAVKETVIHDQGGKTECLRRMKCFADCLRRNGVVFDVDWPPIDDIGNCYERVIYMLRELQTVKERINDNIDTAVTYLSDKLWVSERTIEDDFSYIMPPYDRSVPRSIFQQSLTINGMTRSKGVVEFASTAHPFFLIENLTSLLVLFEALLEKAKVLPFREQAMITARRIWKQLTPYAQGRLEKLLKETYPDAGEETQLFTIMRDAVNSENNAFIVENRENKNPVSYLLDSMKLEIPCKVEYLISGWELTEWTGIVKADSLGGDSLRIGEDQVLYDDIISVKLLER